jgi:hypothetical protein
LLGSLSAFYLGLCQQRRDKRAKQQSALLQAQYALGSQWNILEGIRRNLLEPHRNQDRRFLRMPIYPLFARHAGLPFNELAFVVASDEPDLLQQLHIAEQGFETAIECLRVRNQKMKELCNNSSGVKVEEFDSNSGQAKLNAPPQVIFFLRKATDSLYDIVDQAILKLLGEVQALEAFIKRKYKGAKPLTIVIPK